MAKRNLLLVAILLVLAFSFHSLYTNSIVLWDAYALEIDTTDGIELDHSISVQDENLINYPLVLCTLEEVDENGYTVITFDDGDAIPQFNDFIEENNGSLAYGYTYLAFENSEYLVSMISYGGMDDTPEYLYLSGVMALIAIGLGLSEIIRYFRSR